MIRCLVARLISPLRFPKPCFPRFLLVTPKKLSLGNKIRNNYRRFGFFTRLKCQISRLNPTERISLFLFAHQLCIAADDPSVPLAVYFRRSALSLNRNGLFSHILIVLLFELLILLDIFYALSFFFSII